MKKILLLVLILNACSKQQESSSISFLHINDTHSKHLPMLRTEKNGTISTNGGSAQLATLIKDLKSKQSNIMAIHGGDAVTGSVFSIIYKGDDSTDILNMSGFDLGILGNHEFDFGLSKAYDIITNRNFPTITANAYEKDTGKAIVPPTFTTNISGKSIGFIGLLTSHEVYIGKDKPGAFTVSDEIETLKKILSEDKDIQTNDLLVLISHVGFELDKTIAAQFPNIFDIIVGGHSHTYLEEPVKINDTLIVQVNNNIKELGKLDFDVDKNNKIVAYNYQTIPIKNITPDPEVLAYIQEKQVLVDQEMGGKLATLSDTLEDTDIRKKSTLLGNFISDIVLDNFTNLGIDFIFLNSGSIRSPLEKGDVSLGDMYEIHPFDNTAVYFEISGKVLKDIFALSIGRNYGEGGFVQLSKGIKISVDNGTISSIIINGKPIEDNKIYKTITSDWLYNGGDAYTMIEEYALNTQFIGLDIRDLLIKTLSEKKYIDTSTISSQNRWVFN